MPLLFTRFLEPSRPSAFAYALPHCITPRYIQRGTRLVDVRLRNATRQYEIGDTIRHETRGCRRWEAFRWRGDCRKKAAKRE
jgi:hypothetical protein